MTDSGTREGGSGTTGGTGWPHELDEEYECRGELGRGGMAVVYRARETSLGREVAIKVVRPRFHADEESVARLAREARTVAQLEHPNIVSLHAVKRLTNGLALVMQLVPGRTLKAALSRGALSPAESEHVLRDIARALAYAHRCGVVHRDVKPENIFLDEITGRALLSDFGVARSVEENTELTATGTAIGTPTYMSPEQIDGGHLDGRSDLYSLGMVGWEMLTGQRPWAGESLYSVIYRQKHDPLPPLDTTRPDVPPRLQYLIEGLMHKNADRRWANAARFLALLSGDDVPPGFKEWQAAAKRRRRSGTQRPAARAASASPSLGAPALSTVRFRRGDTPPGTDIPSPDDLQQIAIEDPESTQRIPSTPGALHGVIEEAQEPPRRNRSRILLGAGAVVALAAAALFATRQPFGERPVTRDSTTFADAPGVVVPVIPPADSPASAGATRIDSLRLADSLRMIDSLRSADSVRFAAASARADSVAKQLTDSLAAVRSKSVADSLRAVAAAALKAPEKSFERPPAVEIPPRTRVDAAAPPPTTASTPRDSAATERPAPVAVAFPAERGTIAAGGRHSCLLDESGRALCWGNNDRGQLGDGTFEAHATPVPIAGFFALSSISAGVWHTCAVSRDGDAYCWGSNDAGQLGDGTTAPRSAPVRVNGSAAYRFVRSGQSHSCGLTRTGTVQCWGSNTQGQIGDGSRATRPSPFPVPLGVASGALAVGRAHSCAVTIEGVAYCWGQNDGGQLGDGTITDRATPARVSSDQRFVSIAAGSSHTCAVTTTGTLLCWGKNTYGQLGVGSTASSAPTPVPVDAAAAFSTVTAGQVHTCARTRDGRAWCWGRNAYGQLGDGTTADRGRPAVVRGGTPFASLSASGAHTCGVTAGGEGFCWGYNIDGQLGGGDRDNASVPSRVSSAAR